MERTIDVLRGFKKAIEDYAADDVIAVATAAVRNAGNGEEFVAAVSYTHLDVYKRQVYSVYGRG